jgi:uncharacterized protein
MIAPELLEILRCPETMQRLAPAPPALLERLRCEPLRDRSGNLVKLPIEAGLLREDGAILYPVAEGIPMLIVEESICVPA